MIALAAAAAAGCGAGSSRPEEPAPGGAIEVAAPEPVPSCQVVVNEFIWTLDLRNSDEARDGLVGECVDTPWSSEERRCVSRAEGARGLADCNVDTKVTLVVGSHGPAAEVGIEECDQLIAEFRRCASRTLPTEELADTEEALAETVAAWQRELGETDGVRKVHARCRRLAEAERAAMKRNGCDPE